MQEGDIDDECGVQRMTGYWTICFVMQFVDVALSRNHLFFHTKYHMREALEVASAGKSKALKRFRWYKLGFCHDKRNETDV